MCGSMRHRDAETTRNKPRTDKSHLQIVGQNRMNGSVRDASVLFQLHDGHSSNILNQFSHFFIQRNSGNFLTALCVPMKYGTKDREFLYYCFNLITVSFYMFRPSKCLSSGRLVHAVLWNFFHESSIKHILPSLRLLICMRETNIIKLRVKFFLRIDTWMVETRRRHYN